MAKTTPGRPGRKRSESARRKILDAALRICRRDGLAGLSMEGLAADAGVGKQTVYRWWPSRAAVLLEALREVPESVPIAPPTGSLRRDLQRFVRATFRALEALPGGVPMLRALIAEAQRNDKARGELIAYLLEGRRAALKALFVRAEQEERLRDDLDADLAAELLFGALFYRVLAGDRPLDDEFAEALARTISRAARR